MHLQPGSERPWPSGAPAEPDLALLVGEVALIGVLRTANGDILARRTLCCWDAPSALPAQSDLPEGLELRFKVVRAAFVLPLRGTAIHRIDVQMLRSQKIGLTKLILPIRHSPRLSCPQEPSLPRDSTWRARCAAVQNAPLFRSEVLNPSASH